MNIKKRFADSELPIIDGRVYHLRLKPEELAELVICVGDPERVPLLADELLGGREVDQQHRGLRTITGPARRNGRRISIVTSGMGTPSLEIVLQELALLNEVDFDKRERKEQFSPLRIIRVGTSGALQEDTALGTAVVSDYAVGLDNTGLFYEVAASSEITGLERAVAAAVNKAMRPDSRFAGGIRPYATRADTGLADKLCAAAARNGLVYKRGITVSNSGFFANQGRDVARVRPSVPEIDAHLGTVSLGALKIENLEMESSFLFHFCAGMQYQCCAVCPTVANRRTGKFLEKQLEALMGAAHMAEEALTD